MQIESSGCSAFSRGLISRGNCTYVIKRTRVLSNGIQRSAESAKRPAVNAVAMSSSVDIWPSLVNCRVDHVSSPVEQSDLAPVNNFASFADADQVRRLDERESNTERIDPEGISLYGILRNTPVSIPLTTRSVEAVIGCLHA